jgi:cytochrome c553
MGKKRMLNYTAKLLGGLSILVACFAVHANEHYEAHCAACHGSDGSGNAALKAPNLTHLSEPYMKRQVAAFKQGWRQSSDAASPSAVMAAAIESLDAMRLDQAVSEAAQLIPVTPKRTSLEEFDLRKGRSQYTAFCSSCHGTMATGNDRLGAPALVGLEVAYLVRQYRAFASGARGSHKSDRYGQQMSRLAKALPNGDQIENVMAYVESLAQ